MFNWVFTGSFSDRKNSTSNFNLLMVDWVSKHFYKRRFAMPHSTNDNQQIGRLIFGFFLLHKLTINYVMIYKLFYIRQVRYNTPGLYNSDIQLLKQLMRRQPILASLTPSDIIRTFTSANYEMILRDDREKFQKCRKHIKTRKNILAQNMKRLKVNPSAEDNLTTIEKFIDTIFDFQYHYMTNEQLSHKFDVDLSRGLQGDEARKRYAQTPNIIKNKAKNSEVLMFLSQMADPFSLFIWCMIILSIIGYILLSDPNQLLLAIILLITILSGAIISFGFGRESESIIKDFEELLPKYSVVKRQGEFQTLNIHRIVPGDIVILRQGDKIPADMRLLTCRNLKINRSTFTGQSHPISTTPQCTNKKNPLQSLNMVYSGMMVVEGEGTAIVFSNGESTIISKIQNLITNQQEKPSYLESEISRFVKIISIFAICVGVFVLIGGIIVGFPPVIAADLAIGVAVASAPGILNLELVCILYFSVKQLAKKQLICKNLVAIEAFGSVQILCIDKTGTLTSNSMTMESIYYDGKAHAATNFQDYGKDYSHEYDLNNKTFQALHKCAIVSSVATFDKSPPNKSTISIKRSKLIESEKSIHENERQKQQKEAKTQKVSEKQLIGDSTESALTRFFHPIQSIETTNLRYPIHKNKKNNNESRVLFSSQNKYSISINEDPTEDSHYCLHIKGAPERILSMCKYIIHFGKLVNKQESTVLELNEIINRWGKQGKRVLGFAQLRLPRKKYHRNYEFDMDTISIILKDMTFIGLACLQDPPRKDVTSTIKKIRGAGVKVIMVTGDQETTALSIARQCNITSEQPTVNQLSEQLGYTPEQAFETAKNIVVTGQQLSRIINEQSVKPKHEQGKSFRKLLQKEGIIFARTSPSQKLYIVEQLQNLGFVICVTGDGVNDSPAIKLANVGISMGSGSEAAKDSADIIITNDDLNLICDGIENGRKAFDNFKKAICYVMTSQISQWVPFIILIIFRIPIPIFTLLIDGAADFVPTIAFAFEQSQKGILNRPPKKSGQHLIDFPLVLQSQGWMGLSSFLSCLLAYYIVMNDFGFIPSNLFGKSNVHILLQQRNDFYNPSDPYFGNTNLQSIKNCAQFVEKAVRVDWINGTYPGTDLRISGVICQTRSDGSIYFQHNFIFSQCKVQQISTNTNKPVCYTPEATKYAQTSYMYANVVNQIFNWIICRTRKDSGILKRLDNTIHAFGLGCELMLALSLSFTSFMMSLIGTRDVIFQHYGICTIPYSLTQVCLDELKKYLIRNWPKNKYGQPNWFLRNLMW